MGRDLRKTDRGGGGLAYQNALRAPPPYRTGTSSAPAVHTKQMAYGNTPVREPAHILIHSLRFAAPTAQIIHMGRDLRNMDRGGGGLTSKNATAENEI